MLYYYNLPKKLLTTKKTKIMEWTNIDLSNSYERDQNILDPLNFDTFLLEISTNIKTCDLTEDNIKKDFEERLKMRLAEARDIFKSNLTNITKKAIKERNQK